MNLELAKMFHRYIAIIRMQKSNSKPKGKKREEKRERECLMCTYHWSVYNWLHHFRSNISLFFVLVSVFVRDLLPFSNLSLPGFP